MSSTGFKMEKKKKRLLSVTGTVPMYFIRSLVMQGGIQ